MTTPTAPAPTPAAPAPTPADDGTVETRYVELPDALRLDISAPDLNEKFGRRLQFAAFWERVRDRRA